MSDAGGTGGADGPSGADGKSHSRWLAKEIILPIVLATIAASAGIIAVLRDGGDSAPPASTDPTTTVTATATPTAEPIDTPTPNATLPPTPSPTPTTIAGAAGCAIEGQVRDFAAPHTPVAAVTLVRPAEGDEDEDQVLNISAVDGAFRINCEGLTPDDFPFTVELRRPNWQLPSHTDLEIRAGMGLDTAEPPSWPLYVDVATYEDTEPAAPGTWVVLPVATYYELSGTPTRLETFQFQVTTSRINPDLFRFLVTPTPTP